MKNKQKVNKIVDLIGFFFLKFAAYNPKYKSYEENMRI